MDRKPTAILAASGIRVLATLACPCQVSLSRTSGYQAAIGACLPVEKLRNACPDVLEPSSCLFESATGAWKTDLSPNELGLPERFVTCWPIFGNCRTFTAHVALLLFIIRLSLKLAVTCRSISDFTEEL